MTGEREASEPASSPTGAPAGQEQPEAVAGSAETAGNNDASSGASAGAGAGAGHAGPGDEGTGDEGTGDARPGVDLGEADAGQDLLDLTEIGTFLSGSGGLKEIVAERDEYLDSLRRLQADFDNYRKRAIRQQTELVERSTEGLLRRLLPVLDALDLAMAHLPEAGARTGSDSEAMRSLVQIGTLLRDVLEHEGLERIDQVGVAFDPTIHDAVAEAGPDEAAAEAEPGEGRAAHTAGDEQAPDRAGSGSAADNSVADVMRSGYRLKGRVLRPAMVAVRAGRGTARGSNGESGDDDK